MHRLITLSLTYTHTYVLVHIYIHIPYTYTYHIRTHTIYVHTPVYSSPLTWIRTSERDPLVVTGKVELFTEEFVKGNYIFQSLPAAQVLQVFCRKIRSWSAPTIIPVMKNEAVLSGQGCVCVLGVGSQWLIKHNFLKWWELEEVLVLHFLDSEATFVVKFMSAT